MALICLVWFDKFLSRVGDRGTTSYTRSAGVSSFGHSVSLMILVAMDNVSSQDRSGESGRMLVYDF